MSYEKYYKNGWKSGEAGGTPITPEALNHMEAGIEAAAAHESSTSNPHNVTAAQVGAAESSHTHKYAGSSSAGGAANSVKTNLVVKLNSGSTEGTNLFTYNGGTAKTVNITPSSIGAAASSHNHAAGNITSGTLSSDRLPTVPLTKGGTGATSRLAATKALTNEAVSTPTSVIGMTTGWEKFGYTTLANLASAMNLSPAMNIGTIYTTHEKYKGKTVYAKAVSLDLGTGSGNKYVSVDGSMTEVVSLNAYVLNSYLAYTPEFASLVSMYVNVDSGAFFVNSADKDGWTAYAIVKYIK